MQRTLAGIRMRSAFRIGLPVLIATLLGACMLPPEPRTDAGRDVFNLYIVVLILAGIVFVAVEGFIVYAVIRYRRDPDDEVLPEQLHGNTRVEIIWTLIPTVIVFILFGVSMVTLAEVEARSQEPAVTIEAEGFQWNWRFHYGDVTSEPQGNEPPVMAVPVGEPILLTLRSTDVNHAFFVPEFLIKRDAIRYADDARVNELRFTVTEAGVYAGQCAEFCGTEHATMDFIVDAKPRAEYDAWLEALASGAPPPPPAAGDCETTIEIKADNTQFDIGEFEVLADTEFCIAFENLEDVAHNVAIYDGGTALFTGDFLDAAGEIVYSVPALPAGEYRFICDAHPTTMVGDVQVTE